MAVFLSNHLLSLRPFVRDMREFLDSSEELLRAMPKLMEGEEEPVDQSAANQLGLRLDIPIERIFRVMHFVEFICRRADEAGLEPEDATNQLTSIAAQLEDPISVDQARKDVIREIFSTRKREPSTDVGDYPHFISARGFWSIRPYRTREGEINKVPMMSMSVIWHDGTGNNREAFFQLTDKDWQSFRDTLNELATMRDNLIEDML